MPVSAELEQSLPRFVDAVKESDDFQNGLNSVTNLDQLKTIVKLDQE